MKIVMPYTIHYVELVPSLFSKHFSHTDELLQVNVCRLRNRASIRFMHGILLQVRRRSNEGKKLRRLDSFGPSLSSHSSNLAQS